jgi:chromosome segregation ATPase
LGNHNYKHDENFHKVHPDLAALFREVEQIERALLQLKAKKKSLKDELKSTNNELAKRLNALENWQMKGEEARADSRKRNQNRQ